jgi:uncharacterized membrane protein YccC
VFLSLSQHAEHEEETPIERYKRLMAELQELEQEFNQVDKEQERKFRSLRLFF